MVEISPYLLAIVIGFVGSQLIKTIIAAVKRRALTLRGILFVSGGMPSSHSATASRTTPPTSTQHSLTRSGRSTQTSS